MQKRILIGLGTGRCGTSSLAYVLNGQRECQVTHESPKIWSGMTWFFREEAGVLALSELDSATSAVSGDVAFYYLPYVEWIASRRPDATFICLKRDRTQTVESYLRKTHGRDHWSRLCVMGDRWDRMYPKFDTYDKREAIGMYWDTYYQETDRLEAAGVRIRTFDMSCLNSERGLKDIMDFAGLEGIPPRAGVVRNRG